MRFCILLFCLVSEAFSVESKDRLDVLIRQSDIILQAQVRKAESRWVTNQGRRSIWTRVTFSPRLIVKGQGIGNEIVLDLPGGAVGDIAQSVSELATPKVRDEVVLFLQSNPLRLASPSDLLPVIDGRVTLEDRSMPAGYLLAHLRGTHKSAGPSISQLSAPPAAENIPFARAGLPGNGILSAAAITPVPDTFSIASAWFSDSVDVDSNGNLERVRLHWDPNSNTDSLRSVYMEVYTKPSGDTTWTIMGTAFAQITGTQPDDVSLDISAENISPMLWDFRIDLYNFDDTAFIVRATRGPAQDSTLANVPLQTYVSIAGISPSKASGNTGSTVDILGAHFGNVPDSGSVLFTPQIPGEVLSWSDNEIVCRVPAVSSGPVQVVTNSGRSNHVPFRVTFNYAGRKWAGAHPSIGYSVNESGSLVESGGAAVQAAARTWNEAGGDFSFFYGGATSLRGASYDNLNVVSWDTLPFAQAFAITFTTYNLLTRQNLDCDIVFNSVNFGWSTGPVPPKHLADVQSVGLHEFGHTLSLDHVSGSLGDGEYDNAKVMFPSYQPGTTKRSLHPDDAAGGRWIYGPMSITPVDTTVCYYGGLGSVSITLPDTVGWKAHSNDSWIQLIGPDSGSGSGTIRYGVEVDSSAVPRTGSLWISGKILAVHQLQACWEIQGGWTLLSLPVHPDLHAARSLFPQAVSPAFSYDGGYVRRDSLREGVGYWLKFAGPEVVRIPGGAVPVESVAVRKGWNMVGALALPVSAASVRSIPAGIVISGFFGYNPAVGYILDDTLRSGSGYWAKTNVDGMLLLGGSSVAMAAADHVVIRPGADRPPVPPEGYAEQPARDVPVQSALLQSYPNPFNPRTLIHYTIAGVQFVTLKVYDVLGREVATLVNEPKQPGEYSVEWDAGSMPSGVYFYRLQAGSYAETRRLVLVR